MLGSLFKGLTWTVGAVQKYFELACSVARTGFLLLSIHRLAKTSSRGTAVASAWPFLFLSCAWCGSFPPIVVLAGKVGHEMASFSCIQIRGCLGIILASSTGLLCSDYC